MSAMLGVTVNGEFHPVPPGGGAGGSGPMLVDWLRREARLTGVKVGCNAGACGACTVMVTEDGRDGGPPAHRPVLACLTPLAMVDGCSITTVEGLAGDGGEMHPIQRAFSDNQASQCGFCTPGQVMSLYTLLAKKPDATAADIELALAGNLCRCTGYRTILNAAKRFASDAPSSAVECGGAAAAAAPRDSGFTGADGWSVPRSLRELCDAKRLDPTSAIVAGGTALGLQLNGWQGAKDGAGRKAQALGVPSQLLSTARVPELHGCSTVAGCVDLLGEFDTSEAGEEDSTRLHVPSGTALRVGAAATLQAVEDYVAPYAASSSTATALLSAISNFGWGGHQLRAAATLGGSVCFAPSYSNFVPLLCSLGATLKLAHTSQAGEEVEERLVVCTAEAFHPDGGGLRMEPDEVLCEVLLPLVGRRTTAVFLKPEASLKDDSTLSLACTARTTADGQIKHVNLMVGGLTSFVPLTLTATALCAGDGPATAHVFADLGELLSPSAVGGRTEYRRTLALSLVAQAETILRGTEPMEGEPPRPAQQSVKPGSWRFPQDDGAPSPVGQPLSKLDSSGVTTGEAEFVDDIPSPAGCLHLAYVLSREPRATIRGVDTTKAMQLPGVRLWLSDSDSKREGCFAWNSSLGTGAAGLVEVTYENLDDAPILNMDEALEAGSILPVPPTQPTMGTCEKGDVAKAFESAARVVQGQLEVGGQEHFYLEPFAFLCEPARPGAGEPLTLTLCSQSLAENQRGVATALGVGQHEVVVKARRLGGGFGGKAGNMSDLAAAVAIAATKLRRPARAVLRREEDFALSGKREGLRGKYRVGIDDSNRICALGLDIIGNGGVSPARGTMIKGLLNGAMSYGAVEHIRLSLTVVKSNLQSNTAMRALSVPGVAMICEAAIEHASRELYPSPHDLGARLALRSEALARPSDTTPFGQLFGLDCNAREVWDGLLEQARWEERVNECREFNAASKWKKRGAHFMPSVFGVTEAMTGGALVNVFLDGTAVVHHGGIEMGQGIHIKMAQIAAGVLRIPLDDVRVAETSTDVVPNTSKTAAAAGTDVNGGAVAAAANELAARLAPFREALATTTHEPSMAEVAQAAHAASVSLSAGGHRTGIDKGRFEWLEGNDVRGWECNYFSWGGSGTVVEIDCRTGDAQVLTAEIVLDAGSSINPAVDAAQVEGGYCQSLGWVLKEELIWGDARVGRAWAQPGGLHTDGAATYRIPQIRDAPQELNLTLVQGSRNTRQGNVFSSKGVGEASMACGTGAFFAIRDALTAARISNGMSPKDAAVFELDSPATAERVRLCCGDEHVQAGAGSGGKPVASL